jgi:hypothetical protein
LFAAVTNHLGVPLQIRYVAYRISALPGAHERTSADAAARWSAEATDAEDAPELTTADQRANT